MDNQIKGVLIYYFATGEAARPQFIGLNSMNPGGYINNYSEVYDIELGDQLKIDHPNFVDNVLLIQEDTYNYVSYLAASWKESELPVIFQPHSKHKSWGQVIGQAPKT